MSDDVLLETRDGEIAVLTLNNPGRRNALSLALREELVAALERLEGDGAVRAIVLTGADGNFSSGGDISGMNATDLAAGRERFRINHRLVRLMIKSAKPLIAVAASSSASQNNAGLRARMRLHPVTGYG